MSVLDGDPLSAITARAKDLQPGVALLKLVALLLFGVGWLPAKTLKVARTAARWCAAAVAEGASQAWIGPAGDDR